MGKYINIGLTDFQSVRKDEYIDKSMLIAYVNSVLGTQRKFLCVTRARRFGKSIAAKMLNAYYDESVDSRFLFQDLNISTSLSYEEHLNKYPVIYLDVSGFTSELKSNKRRIVYEMNDALSQELQTYYPSIPINKDDTLSSQLLTITEHTHKQFIMIIDEWDAICREINNEEVMREYVDWLRSLFKSSFTDRIFVGAYMTGILPIKQYNTQSALNNFEEFSMVNPGPLAGYFGFTNEEVGRLAGKYNADIDELQRWYDGYQIGGLLDIYNPYAVMRAVQRNSIESYWTATATYEILQRYISLNFDGLRDSIISLLADNAVSVDVQNFTNDMNEINNRNAVITLLIHLGYLSYDNKTQTARIPNYEVRREFERAIQDTNWKYIAQALRNSERLLQDTLAGNEQAVAQAIELVHQDNTSILQYNDENSLSCVLSIAYQTAHKDYDFIRELPVGKGYADIVLLPRCNVNMPAIVLELKYNKSAHGAIKQIKEKQYAGVLLNYVGEVILVGINYDKRSKTYQCVIERVRKASMINNDEHCLSDHSPSTHQVLTKYSLSTHQVILLLEALQKSLSAKQMRELIGRKDATYFRQNTIQPMIDDGIIAPIDADSMRSPKQKYYLTNNGQKLLDSLLNTRK